MYKVVPLAVVAMYIDVEEFAFPIFLYATRILPLDNVIDRICKSGRESVPTSTDFVNALFVSFDSTMLFAVSAVAVNEYVDPSTSPNADFAIDTIVVIPGDGVSTSMLVFAFGVSSLSVEDHELDPSPAFFSDTFITRAEAS